MDDGFVRVPNAVIDDLSREEIAAWVWLMRTRDYQTNEPTLSVRKLSGFMGWSQSRAQRFLRKFKLQIIRTGSEPEVNRERTGSEPHIKKQETIDKKKETTTTAFVLPEWIPKPSWDAWMEVRKRKKCAQTPRGLGFAISQLEILRDAGYQPGDILDQATMQEWKGIKAEWILKDRQQGQPQKPKGSNVPFFTEEPDDIQF